MTKLQQLPKGKHDIGGYPTTQRGRKARPKQRAAPVKEYPQGFFCQLLKAHDFPPGFVSGIRVDRRTGRFETSWAESLRIRASSGFDKHTITQPGSIQYVIAGPVETMERPK
jgi:hypothetical protein